MHAHAHAIGALDGRRSAIQLLPSPVAHWNPGLGMATSEASVNNANKFDDYSFYTSGSVVTGQPDPDGGTNASQYVETTEGGNHAIYRNADVSNCVDGPVRRAISVKAVGSRNLYINDANDDSQYINVTLATGAIYSSLGVTVSTDTLGSGWNRINWDSVSGWLITNKGSWNATNAAYARAYTGDGSSGFLIYDLSIVHHRCSTLSDQIGTADLSNSSSTSQVFVQKSGGGSPGGNSWGSAIVVIWQPNDTAKTLLTDDADLMTVLDGDFTIVADIWVYAAATAAVPIFKTTADIPTVCGLGTDQKLYVTCGTSVVATAALAVGRHQIAFRRVAATNTWTIFADGALVAGPTALTPGGATTPSELTVTMRCTGLREAIIDSTAVNDTTAIAVLNALKAAA